MRQAFPPTRIIEIAESIIANAESEQTRLQALQMVADRGWGKSTERTEVVLGQPDDEDEIDLTALTDAELDELAAIESARDALIARAGERAPLALPAPTGVGPVVSSTEDR